MKDRTLIHLQAMMELQGDLSRPYGGEIAETASDTIVLRSLEGAGYVKCEGRICPRHKRETIPPYWFSITQKGRDALSP